jgi:hypothetical protein
MVCWWIRDNSFFSEIKPRNWQLITNFTNNYIFAYKNELRKSAVGRTVS